jgi:hypothetical protein
MPSTSNASSIFFFLHAPSHAIACSRRASRSINKRAVLKPLLSDTACDTRLFPSTSIALHHLAPMPKIYIVCQQQQLPAFLSQLIECQIVRAMSSVRMPSGIRLVWRAAWRLRRMTSRCFRVVARRRLNIHRVSGSIVAGREARAR